jgi:DNA sulfur modification protein DndE
MSWKVFGGPDADLYTALLIQRCLNDGLDPDDDTIAEQFRLHLHRGIGYLFGDPQLKSLPGLLERAV